MKKYENYKDSGLEWLGMVPEHWEILPFKRGVSVNNGRDYKHVKSEDGYPVIGSGGQFAYASDYLYDGEVILLGRKGTIDKPRYFSGKFWTVDTMFYAIPNQKCIAKYMYYQALTIPFSFYSTDTALPSMTQSDLGNHLMCFPPISEQRIIASYLDQKVGQIDTLISEKEKMVEDLKAYRSSLITETVTKGLDKGVEMKDSGDIIFKSIPQHWNLIPIKYLTSKVGSGVTPTGGANVYLQEGIIFLRSQNIYPTGLQLDDVVYISEAIDNNMAATRVNKGDVLLNITGASIGRCFTYNRDERANVNQHVCIVRPKQTLLNGKYLQYLFNSNAGQNFINSVQNGTNREGLNFEQIKNFSVPVPSLDEQQTIIKFLEEKLSKIDALQIELEHQLSDLKSYKSSLITEAVTGKIDLRDWQTKKS